MLTEKDCSQKYGAHGDEKRHQQNVGSARRGQHAEINNICKGGEAIPYLCFLEFGKFNRSGIRQAIDLSICFPYVATV